MGADRPAHRPPALGAHAGRRQWPTARPAGGDLLGDRGGADAAGGDLRLAALPIWRGIPGSRIRPRKVLENSDRVARLCSPRSEDRLGADIVPMGKDFRDALSATTINDPRFQAFVASQGADRGLSEIAVIRGGRGRRAPCAAGGAGRSAHTGKPSAGRGARPAHSGQYGSPPPWRPYRGADRAQSAHAHLSLRLSRFVDLDRARAGEADPDGVGRLQQPARPLPHLAASVQRRAAWSSRC